MQCFLSGTYLLNALSADEEDETVNAAFGGNYNRRMAVKKKYDPANFFRLHQNIKPLEYRYKIDGEVLIPIRYPAAEGPSGILATPVFWRNRVYVAIGQDPEHGEGMGNLVCLDATKSGVNPRGSIIWSSTEIHRSLSTVAITPDGLLFIADYSGFLFCLEAWTAKTHWKQDLKAHVWGSPLVADGKVYIGNEDGDFRVFAASKEMKLLSEVNWGAPVYSTPIVANGVLYVATQTHLLALGQAAGRVK